MDYFEEFHWITIAHIHIIRKTQKIIDEEGCAQTQRAKLGNHWSTYKGVG